MVLHYKAYLFLFVKCFSGIFGHFRTHAEKVEKAQYKVFKPAFLAYCSLRLGATVSTENETTELEHRVVIHLIMTSKHAYITC